MPIIQTKKEFSTTTLLQATANLSPRELDKFVSQAIVLRAKRHAPSVSASEAELLLQINQGLLPEVQKRFDELVEKRQNEMFTAEEHAEFLELTAEIEKQDASRLVLIGKLAEIRQKSFDELVKELRVGQS